MNRKSIRRLAGPVIMKQIDALRHELRYGAPAAWNRWKAARTEARHRRLLLGWFDSIETSPPDVLIGANLGARNGIGHHIAAIKEHSSLDVGLAPSDRLLQHLSYHDFHTTFSSELMAFKASGVLAVHSHVYPYFVRWCRKQQDEGINWVHTYHSPYFDDGRIGALEPWQKEINDAGLSVGRRANHRVSVSMWQQEFLRAEFGIETVYIPNGIDVSLAANADANRFADEFGTRDFILYVGRLDSIKNPLDIVLLAESLPDERFVMIGDGLTREGVLGMYGSSVPRNIQFLGEQPRSTVQDAIAACSVLCVTSVWEGLPTIVLEGLLQGRAIVVADNSGCVEAVAGGEFGFIYRQGDARSLSEQTRLALSATAGSGWTTQADAGREMVIEKYDWKVIAPRLDALYRS